MELAYQMEETKMIRGGKQTVENLTLRLWSYLKLLVMTRYKVGA